MTDDEFRSFVAYHSSLFQLTAPEDLAMFIAWKPLILPFDLATMRAASGDLATNPDLNTYQTARREHLRYLLASAGRRRAANVRASAQRENEERYGSGRLDCQLCFDAGIVEVPHLLTVVEGQWLPRGLSFSTFVVSCGCQRGIAFYERLAQRAIESPGRRRIMNLATYEAMNPHWQEQLAEREHSRRATDRAVYASEHADRAGPVVRRVIKQLSQTIAQRAESPPRIAGPRRSCIVLPKPDGANHAENRERQEPGGS